MISMLQDNTNWKKKKDPALHDCMQYFTLNKTGYLDFRELPRLQELNQHKLCTLH